MADYNPLKDEYDKFSTISYMKNLYSDDLQPLEIEARKANIWRQPSIDEMKPWAGFALGRGVKEGKYGLFTHPTQEEMEQISMLAAQQRPFLMSGPLADRVEAANMLRRAQNYNTPYNTYTGE